jgi:hypothetical protein
MKEVKESKKASEEKEVKPEICAIPKEIAIKKINALVEANKEIFEEYFTWVNVINSPVSVVDTQESKEAK